MNGRKDETAPAPADFAIRPVRASDDAPAIRAIQNRETREGVAYWNETPVTEADIRAWLSARRSGGYPVLVAERGGAVIGYGAYGPFRPHEAYRDSVEHSVYVTPEAQGGGIGRALLRALEASARAEGRHVMIGGIEAGNAPSIRLHRAEGFLETARMPEVGVKFGRRLTLVLMQKLLA